MLCRFTPSKIWPRNPIIPGSGDARAPTPPLIPRRREGASPPRAACKIQRKLKNKQKAVSRQQKKKRGVGGSSTFPDVLERLFSGRATGAVAENGRHSIPRSRLSRSSGAPTEMGAVAVSHGERTIWRTEVSGGDGGEWGILDFVPLSASAGLWREQSPRSRCEISFAACSQVLFLLIYVFYFISFVVLSSFNPARPAGAGAKSRGRYVMMQCR